MNDFLKPFLENREENFASLDYFLLDQQDSLEDIKHTRLDIAQQIAQGLLFDLEAGSDEDDVHSLKLEEDTVDGLTVFNSFTLDFFHQKLNTLRKVGVSMAAIVLLVLLTACEEEPKTPKPPKPEKVKKSTVIKTGNTKKMVNSLEKQTNEWLIEKAYTSLSQANKKLVLESINEILKRPDNKPEILYEIAKIYRYLRMFKEGDTLLYEMYKKNNADLEVLTQMMVNRFDYLNTTDYLEGLNPLNEIDRQSEGKETSYKDLVLAIRQIKKRNYDGAIQHLDEALKKDQNFFWAYKYKAFAFGKKRDYKRAVEEYTKAIKLKPKYYKVYIDRANNYIDLKQFDEGLSDINTALKINPFDAIAYYNKAHIYRKQKKLGKALQTLFEAEKKSIKTSELYSRIAYTYEQNSQLEKAISFYTKSIELGPFSVNVYAYRGELYKKLNKPQEALKDFNTALQKDPKNDSYFYGRGQLFQKYKKYKAARLDYQKAYQLNPKDESYLNDEAAILRVLGNYKQALVKVDECIKKKPANQTYKAHRSLLLMNLKRYSEAEQEYTQHLQKDLRNTYYYSKKRGECRIELKMFNAAIQDFKKCLEFNSKDLESLSFLADAYDKLEDLKSALNCYNKIIEIQPSYIGTLILRGNIFKEQGKLDLALADYKKSLKLCPSVIHIAYFEMGNVELLKENLDFSINYYNKSLEKNPDYTNSYIRRAFCYFLKKDFKKSEVDYLRVLKDQPNNHQTYYRLFEIYENLGEFKKSISCAQKVLALNPNFKHAQKVKDGIKRLEVKLKK